MEKVNDYHIFNIENILVNFERKVWVIDKNNPTVPLMKIKESDYNLILSNIFQKQNYKISYNGKKLYLPKKIAEKIDIPLEDVGLSLREFIDKEYIDYSDVKINFNIFNHLRNKKVKIILLSNKLLENSMDELKENINEQLNTIGLEIEKIYYINKNIHVEDKNLMYVLNILLKYTLGIDIDIDENKFILDSEQAMGRCFYYDEDMNIINSLKYINEHFNTYYMNSSEDVQKTIEDGKHVYLSLITPNILNLFKTYKYTLTIDSINESKLLRFNNF